MHTCTGVCMPRVWRLLSILVSGFPQPQEPHLDLVERTPLHPEAGCWASSFEEGWFSVTCLGKKKMQMNVWWTKTLLKQRWRAFDNTPFIFLGSNPDCIAHPPSHSGLAPGSNARQEGWAAAIGFFWKPQTCSCTFSSAAADLDGDSSGAASEATWWGGHSPAPRPAPSACSELWVPYLANLVFTHMGLLREQKCTSIAFAIILFFCMYFTLKCRGGYLLQISLLITNA